MGVHVQRINRQIIRRQVQTLEHLFERQLVPVSENDDFLYSTRVSYVSRAAASGTDLGSLLHFTLDEPQQVLLVHTSRVVDVGIDFSDVVKVPITGGQDKIKDAGERDIPMRNSLSQAANAWLAFS